MRGEAVDAVHGTYTHVGEFKDGWPCGHGVREFSDGTVYDGYWMEGEMHGEGVLKEPGAPVYTGAFDMGKKFGEARIEYLDGSLYEGRNEEGIPQGEGRLYNAALNTRYEGKFASGAYQGEGKLTYLEGSVVHVGSFVDGKEQGQGICELPTGTRYSGTWFEGKRHGRGSMTFVNGSRYEGEYQNGWQSGEGTLVFEDGAVYQGEFLEDKFHGYGILAGMDGSVYAGNWRQGYRHGKGQWMGPKKQMPEAEKTDTPEPTQFNLHSEYWDAVAPGQESQPQAMRPEERIAWSLEMLQEQGALDINRGGYEGEWENDMPHGQGSRQFPGGRRYVGEFKLGVPDGKGFLRIEDGSSFHGFFRAGKFNGSGIFRAALDTDRSGVFGHFGSDWAIGEWRDGTLMEGRVQRRGGIPQGMGSETPAVYTGEIKDGQRQGNGHCDFGDGGHFEGEWVNGGVSRGSYFDANGSLLVGEFEGNVGRPGKGQGILRTPAGQYIGDLHRGQRCGEGWMKYKETQQLESDASNSSLFRGRSDGSSGVCQTFDNYFGGWRGDAFHGIGSVWKSDGSGILDADFIAGSLVDGTGKTHENVFRELTDRHMFETASTLELIHPAPLADVSSLVSQMLLDLGLSDSQAGTTDATRLGSFQNS